MEVLYEAQFIAGLGSCNGFTRRKIYVYSIDTYYEDSGCKIKAKKKKKH